MCPSNIDDSVDDVYADDSVPPINQPSMTIYHIYQLTQSIHVSK